MFLAFDTETTGLPLFSDPSDDPRQPHLVQLAALLIQPNGDVVDSISTIVKPGLGARMEPEAFKAHGISLERARAEGAEAKDVADKFFALVEQADMLIGHNVSFDVRIMRIHAARWLGAKWDNPLPAFCTMKRSSQIVNLPPTENMRRAGRFYPKPPKLEECIQHFFGEKLDGAHDALVDVRASIRVFLHLTQNLGVGMPKPPTPRAPRAEQHTTNPFAATGA